MKFDHNNLKTYRKKFGYTQEQVAEKLMVSRQSVAKWERGEALPDIENAIALADLYEVSVDSLVRNLASLSLEKDDKKHMFGFSRINENRQITLPESCCEIFGFRPGDPMLIIGDEEKGLAIVKVSEIE